jgi:hypothetical protein
MTETEIIDCTQLAERWRVPESWIRSHVRNRTPREQQIPHLQFGRYVRFRWGSPELEAWLSKHVEGGIYENERTARWERAARKGLTTEYALQR